MEPHVTALELAHHIRDVFASKGDVNIEEIRKLLHKYADDANSEKDWRQYCFPNDIHYTRNLIFSNEQFELMVLYWKPTQQTRIHDHAKSRCWAATLSGEVTESVYIPYYPPGEKPVTDPNVCPDLILAEKSVHKIGDVSFIEDDIGLHKLGNKSTQHDAITLHLYSPPIRELTLYEPERKIVSTRRPGFYSIGGVRT
jgi:cysteine dioxygenase